METSFKLETKEELLTRLATLKRFRKEYRECSHEERCNCLARLCHNNSDMRIVARKLQRF